MSINEQGLTYEYKPQGTLETYEWDSPWWEKNSDIERERMMYIGDSISYNVRIAWNKILGEKCYCDNFSTSKGIDNEYLLSSSLLFLKQMVKKPSAIFVNNGLHGWHLNTEEYGTHYEKFLADLKKAVADIPVIMVTTTTVSDESRNALVVERNAKAREIAKKLELSMIDVYPLSTSLVHKDGVHFVTEAYAELAEFICNEWKK